jgi:hypothetical protein
MAPSPPVDAALSVADSEAKVSDVEGDQVTACAAFEIAKVLTDVTWSKSSVCATAAVTWHEPSPENDSVREVGLGSEHPVVPALVTLYVTAPSLDVVTASNVVDPTGTSNDVVGFQISVGVAREIVKVTSE